MHTIAILEDAFSRVRDRVHAAASNLNADALVFRPDPDANSIAWLVWHLTRVQDHHISEIAQSPQAYLEEGWADRLGLDPDPNDIGYGHTTEQVAVIRPTTPDDLLAYHDSVHERTVAYLHTITDAELDRIVDERWDPPVTAAVRIVSVISDCLQHAGQANYVRGLHERR